MALVWVIGSGGMLGTALISALAQSEDTLFDPSIQFRWGNQAIVREQLKQVAQQFSSKAAKGPWKIYWAAGNGTMHSSEEELQVETTLLQTLISCLLSDASLNLNVGMFIFASSAGAIYAGAPEELITETTAPAPINAYGRAKLLQESLINILNKNGQGATAISCRISTLYGFKSKSGKPQGLIAEIVRRTLLNQVVHIYVPLETMRDYISAKNAAIQMIETAAQFEKTPGTHLKIIASGISTSVAQILAIVKAICKRNLRFITQADTKSIQYQRVVQFNSEANIRNRYLHQAHLIEGIAELLAESQKHIAKNGWGQ